MDGNGKRNVPARAYGPIELTPNGFRDLEQRETGDPKDRDPSEIIGGGLPPNLGQDVIPHVYTYTGLYRSIARVYMPSDEALRDSWEHARFMRNDLQIMECLEQRQRSTALLDWHLELDPEDEKKEDCRTVRDELTRMLRTIPRFMQYRECLLHALWYGRAAVQQRFRWADVGGKMRIGIDHWLPVHGDKLVFRYDDGTGVHEADQVGIRVGFGYTAGQKYGRWKIERANKLDITYQGMAYFLENWERPLLAIHKHLIEDGEYECPDSAGRIHGVGIRNRCYWTWYQKQEALAWMMEYLERSAFGIEIWQYPAGNPQAKAQTKTAALERIGGGRTVVLVPTYEGANPYNEPVKRIEPGMAGVTQLREILTDFFGHQIKRYILGQTLTTEATATGLGSNLASIHLDTYLQIVRYDAINVSETLTTDTVDPLKKFNWPSHSNMPLRFVIETESPDVEGKLQAWERAYNMGCKLRAKDVMDLIGAAAPNEDDDVLQHPAAKQQDQEDQQKMMQGLTRQLSLFPTAVAGPGEEQGAEQQQPGQPGAEQPGGGNGSATGRGSPTGALGSTSTVTASRSFAAQRHSRGQDEEPERFGAQWEEGKHPRASGGEFTDKGGGQATHGKGSLTAQKTQEAFHYVPTGFRDQKKLLKHVSDKDFERISTRLLNTLRKEDPSGDYSDEEIKWQMEMSADADSPASSRPSALRAFVLIDMMKEARAVPKYMTKRDQEATGGGNRDYNQKMAAIGTEIRSALAPEANPERYRAQFDESKHPRDEGGQFSETEGEAAMRSLDVTNMRHAWNDHKEAVEKVLQKTGGSLDKAIHLHAESLEHKATGPSDAMLQDARQLRKLAGEFEIKKKGKIGIEELFAEKGGGGKLPERTADTMSEAIGLGSPSGSMSKRAKEAAEKRLSTSLFGEGGLQHPKGPDTPEVERLLKTAKELRDLAARGMKPRAHVKEAARLEKQAAELEGGGKERRVGGTKTALDPDDYSHIDKARDIEAGQAVTFGNSQESWTVDKVTVQNRTTQLSSDETNPSAPMEDHTYPVVSVTATNSWGQQTKRTFGGLDPFLKSHRAKAKRLAEPEGKEPSLDDIVARANEAGQAKLDADAEAKVAQDQAEFEQRQKRLKAAWDKKHKQKKSRAVSDKSSTRNIGMALEKGEVSPDDAIPILVLKSDRIAQDPANQMPKGSFNKYTPRARKQMDDIAWVITAAKGKRTKEPYSKPEPNPHAGVFKEAFAKAGYACQAAGAQPERYAEAEGAAATGGGFDESKHPRDDGGQFSDKGGGGDRSGGSDKEVSPKKKDKEASGKKPLPAIAASHEWSRGKGLVPWDASENDIKAGKVPGVRWSDNLSASTNAYYASDGTIEVSSRFVGKLPEVKKIIVQHEIGHEAARLAFSNEHNKKTFEMLEPFRKDKERPLSVRSEFDNFSGLSGLPGEMVADVYAMRMSAPPGWEKGGTRDNFEEYVLSLAGKAGLPTKRF